MECYLGVKETHFLAGIHFLNIMLNKSNQTHISVYTKIPHLFILRRGELNLQW